MLVKTNDDHLAHIRKPGSGKTWCGNLISVFGPPRDYEICDRCLDAVSEANRK